MTTIFEGESVTNSYNLDIVNLELDIETYV